ncbi:MAG: hypothetical protein KGJ55_11020 [Gammaproteobacteria bacterium]|nr:hypothetical protein [Gammaproteobacteria bacterium]
MNKSPSPTSIVAGGSSTLTWSSSNATSCSASGAWSGAEPVSGSQTVSPTLAGLPAGQAGTTSASLHQYSYDAAGRVTADGVHGYSWNAADELVQIAGAATYAYDALGKRIKTTLASGTLG